MRRLPPLLALSAALTLAACLSPVTNPTPAGSSGPLPLGSGFSVYVATTDGTGVLEYPNGATNWIQLDWSGLYPSYSPYSSSMTFPPVYDVTVSGGVIYAATAAGLIVGSASSWARYLSGTSLNGVSVSGTTVFVTSASGLKYAATSSLGSWTSLVSGINATQWVSWNGGGAVATAQGVYANTTATSPYSAVATPAASTISNLVVSGSTLYATTPVGFSTTGTSAYSWTNYGALGGGVNGLSSATVNGSPTLVLALTNGLTLSNTVGTNLTVVAQGFPVYNVVQGSGATFYYAAGVQGLGILQIDTQGNLTTNYPLAGYAIAKVALGP